MGITVDELLWAAPEWDAQITLVLIQAVFWFFMIPLLAKYFAEPIFMNHPLSEQWVQLNQKTFKDSFGIDFDRDQAKDFALLFIGILVQHCVGGMLTLPVLFGWGPTNLAYALGRHGALCEAGWELQDAMTRTYQITLGGEEGKNINPVPLRIIMCLHHLMGLSLIVPMNIYFSENYYYIWLVCLLQLAAFFAMLFQNYGFLLDVTTMAGLRTMKVITFTVFLIMLYSRGLGYAYVIFKLLSIFFNTGILWFCWGCLVAWGMSVLNVLFLADSIAKMLKFVSMTQPKEDSSPKSKRRASVALITEALGGETRELRAAKRVSMFIGGKARGREQETLKEPFLQVA